MERQIVVENLEENQVEPQSLPPWLQQGAKNFEKKATKKIQNSNDENVENKESASDDAETRRQFNELVRQSKQVKNSPEEVALLRRALALLDEEKHAQQHQQVTQLITKKEVRLLQKLVEKADGTDEEEEEAERRIVDGFEYRPRSRSYKCGELRLPAAVFDKLFPYQRSGVRWMYSLYEKERRGGVCGDDMGMGKTVQVATFLRGMFAARLCFTVLVVAPKSVLINWSKELRKWGRLPSYEYSGTKAQKRRAFEAVSESGGVLLTTYSMATQNQELLREPDDDEEGWDWIILDEGHKIKNSSTQTAKAMRGIQARHRLVLTGTPILNKLTELHALFDFVAPGLLGSQAAFKRDWDQPIVQANHKRATEKQRAVGEARLAKLKQLIEPYFLRRTKEDEDEAMQMQVRKNDLIMWVGMSETQVRLYESFLNNGEVRDALNKSKSPLPAITIIKKICQHPALLHEDLKTLDENTLRQMRQGVEEDECAASGKLFFMMKLLRELLARGHRVLIFSQWVRMLDIIERVLQGEHIASFRIDGQVNKAQDREDLVNAFNADGCETNVFLLTTAVGGLGINLTSADRAIIFDPAWNLIDDQAVDRIYRIGQKRNCVIYRLITCGTVEEKIYKKQVFKGSLIRMVSADQALGESDEGFRYFSKKDLRELFSLGPTGHSETQRMLERMHAHKRVTDAELDDHLDFLKTIPNYLGLSDHDLVFSANDGPSEDAAIGSEAREEAELMTRVAADKLAASAEHTDIQRRAADEKRLALLLDQVEERRGAVPESMKREVRQLGVKLFGRPPAERFDDESDEEASSEHNLDSFLEVDYDEEQDQSDLEGSFVVPDDFVEEEEQSSPERDSLVLYDDEESPAAAAPSPVEHDSVVLYDDSFLSAEDEEPTLESPSPVSDHPTPNSPAPPASPLDEEPPSTPLGQAPSCCVCMDAAIDSVFIACGHACACYSCASSLTDKMCPTCRTASAVIKIFLG